MHPWRSRMKAFFVRHSGCTQDTRRGSSLVQPQIGEEIAFSNVDAAEPIRPANTCHSFNIAQTICVVQRQRKGQRNGITCYESNTGGTFHASIPSVNNRAQQTEGTAIATTKPTMVMCVVDVESILEVSGAET